MWSITILILHSFVVRIHAKDLVSNHKADVKGLALSNHTADVQEKFKDEFANKIVDKLVNKLFANMVAVPQASRPAMLMPSSFTSPRAARTALAPRVRDSVMPHAILSKGGSKEPAFLSPGAKPEVAQAPVREWASKYRSLLKRGLKPVTPQEALNMMQRPFFPAMLVDVRMEGKFAAGHPQGALNVPLFQVIQGNSPFVWTKRVISYSTGVQPTEQNPEFSAEALKQLKSNQPIIIVCDRGGTLETLVDDKKATEPKRYTASLKAASELYDAGFKNLFFLEGGLSEWDREGLPVEGSGSSLPDLSSIGAVIWIPAQIPLYFALIALARNLHLIE
eukprot:gnl/MRDRNA2_/MRDRNA2_53670_c0_seq1.p1 gnl/MRDRNA2_/MRDRNA2_53670_c0~~gnl/MRDRNA2_/MRDRNA2_53670_c0_seq1.p1  ORF type:complete len:335 (-),score=50.01 gnl/MRDRNA2_/MRDRNA2_53670_c0_seq1:210-1214(-)